MKNKIRGLYLVTDPVLTLQRNVRDISVQACRAGIDILQLRDKSLPDDEFLGIAFFIRKITEEFNTIFILNDRAHLVNESKADGVHIGQSDICPEYARELIGKSKILGISCSTESEALRAQASGADYIALSPVFSTATKTDLSKPLGLEGIRRFSKILHIPLLAIGGITIGNVAEIITAGADCAAVVTAITMAEDIGKAVFDLKNNIDKGYCLRNE